MKILKINWGQLVEYPFNAQVWGTVSDWVIILVTAATAVLLLLTFRSQNKSIGIQNRTLEEQQKITKIEQYNHTERIKPEFELTVHINQENYVENHLKLKVSFNFKVLNHLAKNITIHSSNNFSSGFEDKKFPLTSKMKYVNEEIIFLLADVTIPIDYNEQNNPEFIFSVIFILKFQDMDGSNYKQDIVFIKSSSDDILIFSSPVKSMEFNKSTI